MWFFGSASLTLQPDMSGRTLHGFQSGMPLRITSDFFGQTVGELLEKFNTYRGPEQQIRHVWNPETGKEFEHSYSIKSDIVAIVRSASIQN